MTLVLGSLTGMSNPSPHAVGDHWEIFGALTYTGNYTAGGDATVATQIEAILKQVGLGTIDWLQVQGAPEYVYVYNYKTSKLQLFWTGAATSGVLAEFTNATEYPATVREGPNRLFAIGR